MNKYFKVLIDPGHGGQNYGAIENNSGLIAIEKDINFAISSIINSLLENDMNILCRLTRYDDYNLSLVERVKESEYHDCMVSIHCNAFYQSNVNGVEIFHNGETKSILLADKIIDSYCKAFKDMKNRGSKENRSLYIVRKAMCPAVIFECGFLTNTKDFRILINPSNQIEMAIAIVKGIKKYFGV